MPLVTVLSRDSAVHAALRIPPDSSRSLAGARSWDRLLWLIRERPVTSVVLDSDALPDDQDPDTAVAELCRRFPSLGTVLVARPELNPLTLFRLGRAGISDLVLIPLDRLSRELRHTVARSTRTGTVSVVMRAVGGRLPASERHVLFSALDGAPLGWRADDLAKRTGWTRAHLSVRLRDRGMPSAGHLLTWSKLLHAGRWLDDPGRSAESVSRQLEYSSGAAFRRTLHNYVGSTPTSLKSAGALRRVLTTFLDECGLGDSLRVDRSVA